MGHSQVPEIELNKDGSISLTVEILGFEPNAPVEISGNATQASGAVATFYDVQSLPGDHDPVNGSRLKVIAFPVPSREFQIGEAITVVARAAEVWVSNLTTPALTSDTSPPITPVWKEVNADYQYAVSSSANPGGWGTGGAA